VLAEIVLYVSVLKHFESSHSCSLTNLWGINTSLTNEVAVNSWISVWMIKICRWAPTVTDCVHAPNTNQQKKIKNESCFPTVKAPLMTWYRHSFLSHALRVAHYARCAMLTVARFLLHSERSAWHLLPFNLQVTCLRCGRTLKAICKQCGKIFEL